MVALLIVSFQRIKVIRSRFRNDMVIIRIENMRHLKKIKKRVDPELGNKRGRIDRPLIKGN